MLNVSTFLMHENHFMWIRFSLCGLNGFRLSFTCPCSRDLSGSCLADGCQDWNRVYSSTLSSSCIHGWLFGRIRSIMQVGHYDISNHRWCLWSFLVETWFSSYILFQDIVLNKNERSWRVIVCKLHEVMNHSWMSHLIKRFVPQVFWD